MSDSPRNIAFLVLMVWMVLDNVVVFSRRNRGARSEDRHSLALIVVANWIGLGLGSVLGFERVARIAEKLVALQWAGLALMMFGIFTRTVAITQLGRYHMPNVATYSDHQLMDRGLYGVVRHPSYLGAIMAISGYGLALGSWASIPVVIVPALIGYVYRINVEESILAKALGPRYLDYQRRTRRLIPGVY